MRQYEVWGNPIDHSLSPRLHTAAYGVLGWDAHYGRRQVSDADFAETLRREEAGLSGLSLTFPLKAVGFAAADSRDRRAELTGAVNTLVLSGGNRYGANTDVGGIVADLAEQGIAEATSARIVGAGATATSALVALSERGLRQVEVRVRRPEAAGALRDLGERLGIGVEVATLDDPAVATVPLTVSTLPGGASLDPDTAERLAGAGGSLYDVVYGHWPTALAAAFLAAGAPATDGRGMLLHQAVLQLRLFATGEIGEPLPNEMTVVDVMRRALMGD